MPEVICKQHRQGMYNETLRRVPVTIAVVEEQYLLHILTVFVALVIQHVTRMRHIVISGLPRSTIIFHIIS
jgi:hypothetical protein